MLIKNLMVKQLKDYFFIIAVISEHEKNMQ